MGKLHSQRNKKKLKKGKRNVQALAQAAMDLERPQGEETLGRAPSSSGKS